MYQSELVPPPESGSVTLPNGCTLYWETDHAVCCRVYYSDEVGGGVFVWNTALVDDSTLMAAIVEERRMQVLEAEINRRNEKESV